MRNTSSATAGYDLVLRVRLANRPGMLGKITSAIGEAGGNIGAIDIVEINPLVIVRDLTVETNSALQGEEIIAAVQAIPDVKLVNASDPVFLRHLGGKIEIRNKQPLRTRTDLAMAYTPGVARICHAIHDDPQKAFNLTIKRNSVAIVTDGTAVLGLGDIGPAAAMPVMEGKAMLFKEFADIDAFPICLDTKDPDEIVRIVKAIAPGFGGINLEDISAPRCFEIESRLKAEVDIPVFHDDQHGTAVVVLAALTNALRIVNKRIEDIKIIVVGIGAAGTACTKMLLTAGAQNIVGCDLLGAICRGRTQEMDAHKQWYAENTNPRGIRGNLEDIIKGADVFIGLSGPNVLKPDWLRKMNAESIVFALANPTPEIMPEEAEPYVAIIATGRSDYPNQINNVLCFPGMFRGAFDARASEINEPMKLAAAEAISAVIEETELDRGYIIPSVFNRAVVQKVAKAVKNAAVRTGVSRKE